MVMVRTEPPELQILICLVTVLPPRTSPKSSLTGTLLSQPPSDVETAMEATGGLPAEADRESMSIPPSDQTVRVIDRDPAVEALKNRGTPIV